MRNNKIIKKLIGIIITLMYIIASNTDAVTFANENNNINQQEVLVANKTLLENEDRSVLIEEKIAKLNDINSMLKLRSKLSRSEVNKLEKERLSLEANLKQMGVSNEITENIPLLSLQQSPDKSDSQSGVSINRSNGPDFSAYSLIYNINSYYNHFTVDGEPYTLYTVHVSDKAWNNLSYQLYNPIVVQGNIVNLNAANQFVESIIKFTASTAAGNIPSPAASLTVSAIIDMMPNIVPTINYIHGQNVLTITPTYVDEFVKYVYAYDEENDDWVLVLSANRAKVLYQTNICYKDSYGYTANSHSTYTITPYLDYNLYTFEQIVSRFLFMQQANITNPVNLIYSKIDLNLSTGASQQHKYTFYLHGDVWPGLLL